MRGSTSRNPSSISVRVPRKVARSTMPVTRVGMGLRIGQRQRRAPGAADDHPAFEAEFLADHLHVRDQMRQRIVLAASLGAAAAGAALVEQHGMETFGIEQPAMVGLAAAAGPAMQIDGRDSADAADALDIDVVTIADVELLRGQRCKRIGAFG